MTANRSGRGLTRGRLAPFTSCGHVGWGAVCNRCEQGKEMASRAESLRDLVKDMGKTTKTPSWVSLPPNGFNALTVNAGGKRFTVQMSGKVTGKDAFLEAIAQMTQESKRMLARPSDNEQF